MRAVVVANGDVDQADRAHLDGAAVVVAADGGALALERWGVVPLVVVGDMDSVDEQTLARLAARGAAIERHPRSKDRTDLELALARAAAAGADELIVLGAFGGPRLDHGFANAMLLADRAYEGVVLRAVRGATTVSALRGPGRRTLAGLPGDVVSLVPLGDVTGVRTEGLVYPLRGETLPLGRARGVSNQIRAAPAFVSCDLGVLLIIETRDGGSERG